MTTPAIDVSGNYTSTYHYDTIYLAPPKASVRTNKVGSTGYMMRKRPASGTSPVRPDGSRAPRPWEHQWCDFNPGLARQGLLWTRGNTQSTQFEGLVPAYGDIRTGLSESGAGWIFKSDLFPVSVENLARTRALLKLADGKAQLGNTLGELRQTAEGVKQICEQIVDGVELAVKASVGLKRKAVRQILQKGKVSPKRKGESPLSARNRMKQERRVLDAWMQAQMSIKPTVMDVDQIGRALSDHLFNEKRALRATIKAGAEDTFVGRKATYPSGLDFGSNAKCTLVATVSAKCHISAVYDIPVSGTRDAQQWGISNPASVAWELTAFSWLCDYVVDVGGWLESLSATQGTTFLEGSITKLMKVQNVDIGYEVVKQPPSPQTLKVLRGNTKSWTPLVGRMSRVCPDEILPGLLPSLKKKIGLTQMANALTVLANFGKR